MIDYPSELPCPSREGHTHEAFAGLVRTPMEAGNTRQRRTHRVLPHQIDLTFVMQQRVYAQWLTWVNAHAFDEWVRMALPGVAAGRVNGADTWPTPVRFVSDIAAELLQVHRLWYWRARVRAEWLPTPDELAPLPFGPWIVAGIPAYPSTPDRVLAGALSAPAGAFVRAGTPATPSATQ